MVHILGCALIQVSYRIFQGIFVHPNSGGKGIALKILSSRSECVCLLDGLDRFGHLVFHGKISKKVKHNGWPKVHKIKSLWDEGNHPCT